MMITRTPGRNSFTRPLRLCILTLAVLATGCSGSGGPERASISGKVTLDGEPIGEGAIAFIPSGGTLGPTAGAVIQNGEYRTPAGTGPVLGTHRVEITAFQVGERQEVKGVGDAPAGPSGAAVAAEAVMYIPEQYNKKSTLTVDITSGRNQRDFDLKSKP